MDKKRKGRRREVVVFFSECVGKKRQAGKNKSFQAEGCETSDPKTLLTQHWIIKPDLESGRIVRRWTPGSPERNIGGKIKRDERGCKTIDIGYRF